MWWYKKHNEPLEKWMYYPWYKALKYATYYDWRYEFPDAIGDVSLGLKTLANGICNVLKFSVLWVLTPVLKPIAFIKDLPKIRKDVESERERALKEWQGKKGRPE